MAEGSGYTDSMPLDDGVVGELVSEAHSDIRSEPVAPRREPAPLPPPSPSSSEYVDDMEIHESIIDSLINEARRDLNGANE